MNAPITAEALGKRYGTSWALRDCSLAVPEGSIAGLIGPNGAGKTTLLRLAVGLAEPSAGRITTLGLHPREDAAELLPKIGFVAQDRPLYARLTVEEICEATARLNRGWDRGYAYARLDRLGINRGQKCGTLSGGQQAQVALVLALAKHPALLLLDEPTASLDPLARREFMQVLMDHVAAEGATVIISSHNVPDLERVCDHVIILSNGRVRLSESLDDFLRTHRLLVGPRASKADLPQIGTIVHATNTDRQTTLVVRANGHAYDPRWDVRDVGFEEVVLSYLAEARSGGDKLLERTAP